MRRWNAIDLRLVRLFSGVFLRWPCDVWEARLACPAALVWIMAQGQLALIHWHGKSSNHWPSSPPPQTSSPASRSNLITLLLECHLVCLSSALKTFRSACVHTPQLCLRVTPQVWVTDKYSENFQGCTVKKSKTFFIVRLITSCVYPPDLPPPPIPPPAVLKSPTHPSKAALEGRGVISPKAGEGRDKRGGGYRPQEGLDPRTSLSERKDAQDRQKAAHGGKGSKPESSTANKARQKTGTATLTPLSVTFLFRMKSHTTLLSL